MAALNGHCLCQSIQFSVSSSEKWMAHCHCPLCRQAHGAALVTWIGVNLNDFKIDQGRAKIKWFASSEEGKRAFCSDCGSTLFFQSERWPDEIHITAANIKRGISLSPQAHVWFDRKVDWINLTDDLPRLGGKNGTTPLK